LTLKNEAELARYLGAAFQSYANRVQRGKVEPYLKFLSGAETVTVTIRLTEPGGIIVEENEKIEALEETVKIQEKTIKSLTPVKKKTTTTVIEEEIEDEVTFKPKPRHVK
jgi:hypothetical protein